MASILHGPKAFVPNSKSDEDDDSDEFDIGAPQKPMAVSHQPIFSPKKSPVKAVYRHKWHSDEDEGEKNEEPAPKRTVSDPATFVQQSERKNKFFTAKLKRTVTQPTKIFDEPISQIKCRKEEKEMYTVVKNVKQAHQCHEWGEAQEFTDDMEYYLSTLIGAKENNVKYLSVSTLAQKCVSANFRAQVRAQGFVKKLFSALSDSYLDPTLALCTACVFYLLSRDRLSIVIDEPTLSLVLNLMKLDSYPSADVVEQCDYRKYKQKVYHILCDWHKTVQNAAGMGQNVLFDLTEENLSSSFLATEALVFVFLRTKHESFKLSMCKLGGLDLIVQRIVKEVELLPSRSKRLDSSHLMQLKLLERYLRILEQCTHECSRNQAYLITFEESSIVKALVRLFEFCHSMVPSLCSPDNKLSTSSPSKTGSIAFPSKVLVDTLSSCFKVLCNLTHLNELCCTKLSRINGFMEGCVEFVISTIPCYLHSEDRFDLTTLSLGLLVNLVEPCNLNRRTAIKATISCKTSLDSKPVKVPVVEALTKMFLKHEAAAQAIDEEVDRHIESCSQDRLKGSAEEVNTQIQESLNVAVSHAGRHMEDCIISSYVALFIGLMLQQNEDVSKDIKLLLGNRSFEPLIAMLKKFLDFLRLINNLTTSSEKTMCMAMELLESLM